MCKTRLKKEVTDGAEASSSIYTRCYLLNKQNAFILSHLNSIEVKRDIPEKNVFGFGAVQEQRSITQCWVFFQQKCLSQRRTHSSNWHCRKDSFKNQTDIEDCVRDMTGIGKGERGGG